MDIPPDLAIAVRAGSTQGKSAARPGHFFAVRAAEAEYDVSPWVAFIVAFEILNRMVWAKALAMRCPIGQALPGCAFAGLRTMPIRERILAIEGTSEPEMDKILDQHRRCLKVREREVEESTRRVSSNG